MLNLDKYPTNCFSPVYQQIINTFSTDEGMNGSSSMRVLEGAERQIKEELVRCIWFGQHIKKDMLFTDDAYAWKFFRPDGGIQREAPISNMLKFSWKVRGL